LAIPSPAPRVSNFGQKDLAYDTVITPVNGATTSGAGSVASGTVKLPYFSGTPNLAVSPLTAAYVYNGWVADDTLGTDLSAVLTAAGVDASAVAAPSTNVTRHFPLAKLQSWQDVPVTIIYSENGCSTKYKPVIFQHGITSSRKASFGVAAQLLAADPCYATVAIDLPQHGLIPTDATLMTALGETTGAQRHFGLKLDASTGQPTAMTGTSDSSGSLFIQLASFQGSRDNARQAVVDLLNLNASLAFMDFTDSNAGYDFDMSKVYFIGHSLGAILGSNFVAVNNKVGPGVDGCATCNSMLPEITAAVLANPGGSIVKLLENSGSFGPQIIGGLAALGAQASLDLSQGSALFELTLNIFQATVDSADPINFASTVAASDTPILMFEIAGDADNLSDTTVPVDALSATLPAPLAGTEPLITAMGLTAVDQTQDTSASLKSVVRFTQGQHTSFAGAEYDGDGNASASTVVFPEMMTQVGSFFNSDGQDLTVTNSNIVKAAQ